MWKTILNVFFPKYCVECKVVGNYICDACFARISFATTPICPVCQKSSITGSTHNKCKKTHSIDGLISAVVYGRVIKRLIYRYKYKPYVSDLTSIIGTLMSESLVQNETFFHLLKNECVMTPVPLYPGKLKKRGYNHASLLCSYVAQYFSIPFQDSIISRVKNTSPQFKLSRSARAQNVKNAFVVQNTQRDFIQGKRILVVDDVATSCSTLKEIAHVLKRAGAKEVWGVTFARENNRW